LPERDSRGRGHLAKLPPDLLCDGLGFVRRSQPGRLGGIGGGTKGMRAHMRDARRLPGCTGCRHCRRSAHLPSGGMRDEAAAGLCDAELAASERA
jgi:hypothetical protein